MECSKDAYPDIITEEQIFLPETPRSFLAQVAATGLHCACPFTSWTVGAKKVFGSRFLVDTLNHLGFSSSYTEVIKFEVNAAHQQGIDLPRVSEVDTIQFVVDNTDHNTVTLDGHTPFMAWASYLS